LDIVGKGGRLGALLFLFQPLLQLGDMRLSLPQFLICHFDFPVEIAALGANAALLHSGSGNA